MLTEVKGLSEETTTGFIALYEMIKKDELNVQLLMSMIL